MVLVSILTTITLQVLKVIDLLANITDLYLFGILLPTMTFAITLVLRGEARNPLGTRTSSQSQVTTRPFIQEQSIENLRTRPKDRFKSDLWPHQAFFHRGDPILFEAHFKGELDNGFVAAYIKKPGGSFDGVYDLSTVEDEWRGRGSLDGSKPIESFWSWVIPREVEKAPIGKWGFFLYVASYYPPKSRWVRLKVVWLHWRNRHRSDLDIGKQMGVAGDWHYVEVIE